MLNIMIYNLLVVLSVFQQVFFPKDETGKYTLMEVVETPGYTEDVLFANAQTWGKEHLTDYSAENELPRKISGRVSCIVYNKGSMRKHPDGVVEYDCTIEIKDGRFRYTLTNYTFIPYVRNRYAKFEPQKSKSSPLEREPSAINKANWNNYIKTAYTESHILIEEFSKVVLIPESKEPKSIKRDNAW